MKKNMNSMTETQQLVEIYWDHGEQEHCCDAGMSYRQREEDRRTSIWDTSLYQFRTYPPVIT